MTVANESAGASGAGASTTVGPTGPLARRDVLAAGAGLAALATIGPLARRAAAIAGRGASTIRVGLVGCGGRGTGAAADCLAASELVELVAMGDVFADRLAGSHGYLAALGDSRGARVRVDAARRFTGFDAYEAVMDAGVDLVILTTPPHFRPMHLRAAVDRGLHVFMEKPVAVDPAGIRTVLEAGDAARAEGLSIVAGTQRRHERSYLEAMTQVRAGRLGRIVSCSCFWNQGGLWKKDREAAWSDMEWQLRNWLYFTWLSGDHIVEQHVHNLDVCNWAIGAAPVRATGLGGREVRTSPEYGHVFDHFAVEFEYPGGEVVTSMCRQIDGTTSRVEEVVRGTEGVLVTRPGFARIHAPGDPSRIVWQFEGDNPNPYVEEHRDLVASIRSAGALNEARAVAESTMTAILGRLSSYTGRTLDWTDAIASPLDLSPARYAFESMEVPPVAVPGRTRLPRA